jgi:hypothetical protein
MSLHFILLQRTSLRLTTTMQMFIINLLQQRMIKTNSFMPLLHMLPKFIVACECIASSTVTIRLEWALNLSDGVFQDVTITDGRGLVFFVAERALPLAVSSCNPGGVLSAADNGDVWDGGWADGLGCWCNRGLGGKLVDPGNGQTIGSGKLLIEVIVKFVNLKCEDIVLWIRSGNLGSADPIRNPERVGLLVAGDHGIGRTWLKISLKEAAFIMNMIISMIKEIVNHLFILIIKEGIFGGQRSTLIRRLVIFKKRVLNSVNSIISHSDAKVATRGWMQTS